MEHLIGLLSTVILMAGVLASVAATAPLFAHLPISEWLRFPMSCIFGFFNSLTAMILGIDLLEHGVKWREFDRLPILAAWLLTVIACGVACIADYLLAARRLPCWEEQLGVTVVGVGVWILLMKLWGRWMEAGTARIRAANRQNGD